MIQQMLSWLSKVPDKFIFIVPIVMAIFLFSYLFSVMQTVARTASMSEFDKLFVTKDQNKINTYINTFTLSAVVNIFFLLFGIGYYYADHDVPFSVVKYVAGFVYVFSVLILLVCMLLVFIHPLFKYTIKLFKLTYQRVTNKKFKTPSESFLKVYKAYLKTYYFTLFLSGYISYIGTVCSMVSDIFSTQQYIDLILLYLSMIAVSILGPMMFFWIAFDLLKISSPPKKYTYKMTIPHIDMIQNQPLYVLYSLDANRIVLGNKPEEINCNHLYIYDRDKHRYLLFMRQ